MKKDESVAIAIADSASEIPELPELHLLRKTWDIGEINWSAFRSGSVPSELMYVLKTTALVESRADMYAGYLLSVFAEKPDWHDRIRVWNLEERQHGQSLRRWCEASDLSFDFHSTYSMYIEAVQYHEENGSSVRGSIQDELVSRCTVEALASAYYAALHDATIEPLLRDVCSRLRQDEARHFSMFLTFLRETGPLQNPLRAVYVSLKRMIELDDDQIMYAAFCIDAGGYKWPSCRSKVKAKYFAQLLSTYKLRHTYNICGMLLKMFDLKQSGILHRGLALAMFAMLRLRLIVYKVIC